MSDETKESRFDRDVRETRNVGMTALIWSGVVFCLAATALSVYGALVVRRVDLLAKRADEEMIPAITEAAHAERDAADARLTGLETRAGTTLDGVDRVTHESELLLADLRTRTLPEATRAAKSAAGASAALEQTARASAPVVPRILADADTAIVRATGDTDDALSQLSVVIRDADGTVREVTGSLVEARTFAEGEERDLAAAISEATATVGAAHVAVDDLARARLAERAGVTIDNAGKITTDLAAESAYVRSHYFTDWSPTAKTALGRFGQRLGHYTLVVLRDAAGLATIVVNFVPHR